MSKSTEVLVLSDDDDALAFIETRLPELARWHASKRLGDHPGEPDLCGVAIGFENLDTTKLLTQLAQAPWARPLGTTVLVHGEDDDCWRVFLSDGTAFVELALPGSTVFDGALIRRPEVEIDNGGVLGSVVILRSADRWQLQFGYPPDGAIARDDLGPGDLPVDAAKELALERLRAVSGPEATINWKAQRSPDRVGGPVHHPDRP